MNFMNGRYGKFDMLDQIIILVAAILCMFRYTRPVSILLVLFVLYRFFSKDVYKRQQEELKFQDFIRNALGKSAQKYSGYNVYKKPLGQRMSDWFNEKKNYKIFTCKNCGQKLRVPSGKGKITITCRKCGVQFKARS